MKELKDVLHYYWPHNVKIIISHRNQPDREANLTLPFLADCTGVKPILHPLEKFSYDPFSNEQIREIIELSHGTRTVESLHLSTAELCFENHIDIFGLIGIGQAIESKQNK